MTNYADLVKRLQICVSGLLRADGDRDLGFQPNITTTASMQLVDELRNAADAITALVKERDEWEKNHEALQDKIDCMKSCGCAYDAAGDICMHHSPKLLAAESQVARLKEALKEIVERLNCRGDPDGDPDTVHYCPNCDNSLHNVRAIARLALGEG